MANPGEDSVVQQLTFDNIYTSSDDMSVEQTLRDQLNDADKNLSRAREDVDTLESRVRTLEQEKDQGATQMQAEIQATKRQLDEELETQRQHYKEKIDTLMGYLQQQKLSPWYSLSDSLGSPSPKDTFKEGIVPLMSIVTDSKAFIKELKTHLHQRSGSPTRTSYPKPTKEDNVPLMFCPCGYTYGNGDCMAAHLVACGETTCYTKPKTN